MRIEAIVYYSSAGTSRQYAERLGQLSQLPVLSLRQAKRTYRGRPVVFVSWICSGVLMNYERAAKHLDICSVCAVGIGTEAQARADLKKQHKLEGDRLFFLPGVFNMKRLNPIYRKTMKDMEYALAMRVKDSKRSTQADQDSYNMLKNGVDYYNEEALVPVMHWLAEP